MPVAVGDKLGHYEVLSLLGHGGMGEVYRARDTTLKRDVALKVLPAAFLLDHDRMARFQREAEVLASLDHPNIGPIHGMVDSADSRALVLALIEGPTLADRIAAGPLREEEAISIATQIIDALEYAHDRGVVHRDLKPANIKITPEGVVKVLDFGLAKVLEDEPPASSPASSPTLTLGTRSGVILGTAAYMSPEQAVGRPVDRRSDIFSFGAVLYEMLTGARAFPGATTPDVLEAVVKSDADWAKLPASTPGYLRRLLQRTLAKDRKQRLQAIGEARIALSNPVEEAPAQLVPAQRHRAWLPWGIAALFLLALLAVSILYLRKTPRSENSLRLSIPLPDKFSIYYIALSPDGRTVAIAGSWEGQDGLWLRALDTLELKPLLNGSARHPFWSPDGRSLGFFADGKLRIIPATGGVPTPVCDAGTGSGGSWSSEGVILFGADSGPIQRVNAAGGPCTPATRAEPGARHRLPTFLFDGNHFLYLSLGADRDKAGLYLGALTPPAGAGRRLLPDLSSAIFVARNAGASHDYLLFQRENTLVAQPFKVETLEFAGDPFLVAPQLSRTITPEQVAASAAGNGTLIYLAGDPRDRYQPMWLDRTGKELGKVGPLGDANAIALSPDQKTVAIAHGSHSAQAGVWLRELARDVEMRFVLPPFTGPPVWSPDSSRIAFSGRQGLYVKSASGGQEELLLQRENPTRASDWSADGKHLLYTEIDPKTRGDIWVLPFDSSGKPGAPAAFLKTEFNESQGQFSPDGHWVAYVSNESGENEVYVRPFPSGGGPIRISSGGDAAVEPRWRRDGKELYYLRAGSPRTLMSVSMKSSGGPLQVEAPKVLFPVRIRTILTEGNDFSYSAAADGRRFLMNVLPETVPPTLNVITNWEKAAGK